MRPQLGTFVALALCLDLIACGSARRSTVHPSAGGEPRPIARDYSTYKNDRDNDGDHNDDDGKVLYFGHAASADDYRVSAALLRHYFAAAATSDGRRACTMLAPFIAESVAEDNGHWPALRGKTCRVVMSKLFELHHRELVEKNATLRVIKVRVEGNRALAVLEFPTIPVVHQMVERRVGGTWKLLDLLDGILE